MAFDKVPRRHCILPSAMGLSVFVPRGETVDRAEIGMAGRRSWTRAASGVLKEQRPSPRAGPTTRQATVEVYEE